MRPDSRTEWAICAAAVLAIGWLAVRAFLPALLGALP